MKQQRRNEEERNKEEWIGMKRRRMRWRGIRGEE